MEHSKSKSTQPRSASRCSTLYRQGFPSSCRMGLDDLDLGFLPSCLDNWEIHGDPSTHVPGRLEISTHLVAADPCAVEPSGGELAVHGVLQLHPPPIYGGWSHTVPFSIVDLVEVVLRVLSWLPGLRQSLRGRGGVPLDLLKGINDRLRKF